MFLGKSFFKQGLALLMFVLPSLALAQASRERLTLSMGRTLWQEKLKAISGDTIDNGAATYSGWTGGIERNWFLGRWGTGASLQVATGQAAAGAFSGSVPFPDKGPRAFSTISLAPRLFYRWTGQVQLGGGASFALKNVSWNSKVSTTRIDDAGRILTIGWGELRLLLTPEWELSQKIGSISGDNETFWQLSLGYRL